MWVKFLTKAHHVIGARVEVGSQDQEMFFLVMSSPRSQAPVTTWAPWYMIWKPFLIYTDEEMDLFVRDCLLARHKNLLKVS